MLQAGLAENSSNEEDGMGLSALFVESDNGKIEQELVENNPNDEDGMCLAGLFEESDDRMVEEVLVENISSDEEDIGLGDLFQETGYEYQNIVPRVIKEQYVKTASLGNGK